jgi:uncharacterized membrane protein
MKRVAKKRKPALLMRLHAIHRILLCLTIAVIVYFLSPRSFPNELGRIMTGWDVFALTMLVLNWLIFFTTDHHHIRQQAKDQDGSRFFIFVITLVCTFASLLAVIILLISQANHESKRAVLLPVAIGGLGLSWLLIHTTFTYRYAHLYYSDHEEDSGKDAEGLAFPEEPRPDLLDFAYFSFVLGMTFQVSDVSITSSRIRQLALMHGLVSFAYNTAVIALTINVVAGLTNK